MSAALTMIMFVAGLINGVLSCLTFQNKELREIGCGVYLLASSITSILTVSIFTVKFWFVVITHMNVSNSYSVLRGGCVSIEPILKLFVYLDTWLNACVATERALNVSKGLKFDRAKSKRCARWIIIILPIGIMSSIIHEPIKRELFGYKPETNKTLEYATVEYKPETNKTLEYTTVEYKPETNKTLEYTTAEYMRENSGWCIARYSRFLQIYNTVILFFHLLVPFTVNLFSALFIIFGVARQRLATRPGRSYKELVHEQLNEHKQLLISPLVLVILASPRLIIALLPGCVNVSRNPWLYLSAYFISFTPSMVIFIIFVLPSDLYRKKFKESLSRPWQRRIHR